MAKSKLFVREDLIREIMSREDAPLVIVEKFEEYDDISDGWFGIHTLFLLGLMKNRASFEALKKLIKENDFEEWTTEELCHILANFGEEFFDDIAEIVMDRGYGIWNRDAAYRALLMINPNRKLKELSKNLIRGVDNEEEKELICLLIPRMMTFHDEEIYMMCKEFVKKHGSCYPVFHDYELGEMWEEEEEIENKKNLWEHFSKQNLCYLYKINYGKPKIGRNDPCICGSGRKYKNCCWKYFM